MINNGGKYLFQISLYPILQRGQEVSPQKGLGVQGSQQPPDREAGQQVPQFQQE